MMTINKSEPVPTLAVAVDGFNPNYVYIDCYYWSLQGKHLLLPLQTVFQTFKYVSNVFMELSAKFNTKRLWILYKYTFLSNHLKG